VGKSKSIIFLIVGVILGGFTGYFIGKKQKIRTLKDEYEMTYATFNGGTILGKDVLIHILPEVENMPKAIYELKKRTTLEVATRHILTNEAAKRKIQVKDLAIAIQKEHANDEVKPEEFNLFLQAQGLNPKKVPKKDLEGFKGLYKRQKVMSLETNSVDDFVKAANIKLSIPE
jgi:hypothetical protein